MLIGLALLIYCVKDIRVSELRELLTHVNAYYLIPAMLSGLLFMIFKGLRWRTIISRQKTVPYSRAITLYSAGQILSIIMPALTGQVGKIILFSRKEDLRKTFVFSTFVLEILFDAVSLIVFMLLTSLAFVFPSEYRYLSYVVVSITVVGLLALYLLLHYQLQVEEISRRTLRSRWPGAYVTVKKFIRSFTKGINLLRASQHIISSLSYSLLSWTAHMLVVWYLIMAFGFEVPFAAAAVIMIINTIILMIPITPGNAGTFEITVSTSLAAFAVGRSDAVMFALALHIMDLLPVFIFSSYFLHLDRASLREIRTQHEKEVILDRINEDGTFIEEEAV